METTQQTERIAEQRFREVRDTFMCRFWNVSDVVYLIQNTMMRHSRWYNRGMKLTEAANCLLMGCEA